MVKRHKSLRCEAWPATVAFHGQLPPSDQQSFDASLAQEISSDLPFKAVFFPHPVYLSRPFTPEQLEAEINRPDYFTNEVFMEQSSFNWKSWLTADIYGKWRLGQGEDACRLPSFMHPIKMVGY